MNIQYIYLCFFIKKVTTTFIYNEHILNKVRVHFVLVKLALWFQRKQCIYSLPVHFLGTNYKSVDAIKPIVIQVSKKSSNFYVFGETEQLVFHFTQITTQNFYFHLPKIEHVQNGKRRGVLCSKACRIPLEK